MKIWCGKSLVTLYCCYHFLDTNKLTLITECHLVNNPLDDVGTRIILVTTTLTHEVINQTLNRVCD